MGVDRRVALGGARARGRSLRVRRWSLRLPTVPRAQRRSLHSQVLHWAKLRGLRGNTRSLSSKGSAQLLRRPGEWGTSVWAMMGLLSWAVIVSHRCGTARVQSLGTRVALFPFWD